MAPPRSMYPSRFIQFFVNVDDRTRSIAKGVRKVCYEQSQAQRPETIIKRRTNKYDDQPNGQHKGRKRQWNRTDKLKQLGTYRFGSVDREGHDDPGEHR